MVTGTRPRSSEEASATPAAVPPTATAPTATQNQGLLYQGRPLATAVGLAALLGRHLEDERVEGVAPAGQPPLRRVRDLEVILHLIRSGLGGDLVGGQGGR